MTSDERTEKEKITLLLSTRRPSGGIGRLEIVIRATVEGGLHRRTAQQIIHFLHSEIQKMDKETAGIEHKPDTDAEFGRGMKSSWPRKE